MRLCTVSSGKSAPFFGVELKSKVLRIVPAAMAFGFSETEIAKVATSLDYFRNLPASEKILRKLLQMIAENPRKLATPSGDGVPYLVDQAALAYLPPIERPGKFLCIGLNYKDHCAEQNKELPKKPVVFNKFATSLIGHGADIPLPLKVDTAIDYEAEFAFVIGKLAKRVSKKSAMKHVGGYLIVNDVSLRTVQKAEPQWSRAKGFDGSGPCGPCIVTPDEVPDPANLDVALKLNGKVMQRSNTSNLVFDVAHLIHFISQAITLEPGDIVSTGTPGGVGMYRNPQVFLKDGDIVEVSIDRLGTLKNRCVAAK